MQNANCQAKYLVEGTELQNVFANIYHSKSNCYLFPNIYFNISMKLTLPKKKTIIFGEKNNKMLGKKTFYFKWASTSETASLVSCFLVMLHLVAEKLAPVLPHKPLLSWVEPIDDNNITSIRHVWEHQAVGVYVLRHDLPPFNAYVVQNGGR